jgi:phenylacetaldehyde dehydrogenase
MSLPELLDLIDGRFQPPLVALGPPVPSPNDGVALYPRVGSEVDTVEAALAAAARVHAEERWSAVPAEARAQLLERVANELEARQESIARCEAETTGAVLVLCRSIAALLPHTFRGAAAVLRRVPSLETLPGRQGAVEVHRLPRGPAAVIAPWNAPVPIAAHKVASALAAGCPVILKPSDLAPHGCGLLAEAIAAAGLPAGSFQLVHGGADVGQMLVADARVRAVSFTGGLSGGRA